MKKRNTYIKAIALSLVGITISTPIFNSVSALDSKEVSNEYNLNLMSKYGLTSKERQILENKQNTISDTSDLFDLLYSEEGILLMKIEFQEMFGTENNFKLVSDSNNIKVEVNGATGEIRITNSNNETMTINYFEGINKMKNSIETNEEISPYYSLQNHYRSTGPDDLYLKVYVQSGKSNKIVARNSKGSTKTYYKSPSNWNSGNTSIFRSEINSASNNWNKAVDALDTAGKKAMANVIAAYVAAGSFNVPAATISTVLGSMGVIKNLATASTRAANYLIDVGQANSAHSKL